MTHSSEVFFAARRHGWSEELGHRSVYGDQFVTYRKGDQKINVQGGREGRIVWCTYLRGGHLIAHLTCGDSDKAGRIVFWMSSSTPT